MGGEVFELLPGIELLKGLVIAGSVCRLHALHKGIVETDKVLVAGPSALDRDLAEAVCLGLRKAKGSG